jgi:hypothetical protein
LQNTIDKSQENVKNNAQNATKCAEKHLFYQKYLVNTNKRSNFAVEFRFKGIIPSNVKLNKK